MVNMSRLSQYIATSILSRVSGPDSYVWLFLFPQLLQVRLVSKSQTMGTGVAVFFTQRKSFSHPEFQSRQQLQNTQRCRYWPILVMRRFFWPRVTASVQGAAITTGRCSNTARRLTPPEAINAKMSFIETAAAEALKIEGR